MCGRFFSSLSPDDLAQGFGLIVNSNMAPRYNIAPTQPVGVVHLNDRNALAYTPMRWGLVPGWAREVGKAPLINARAETVADKPSFRGAYRYRRGLVPASGWYEWQTHGKAKLPFAHGLETGGMVAFACIWELWEGRGDGSWLESFALLTMEAIGPAAAIHNRMPVLVHPDNVQTWLGGARDVLPAPSAMPGDLVDRIQLRAANPAVNKVSSEGPDLLTAS